MSNEPKTQSPSLALKLFVALFIGGALMVASAFFVFAYVARIGGSPGFFSKRAWRLCRAGRPE